MQKPLCSIQDCEGRVAARDYCRKHYGRWWNYGDPLFTKRPTLGINEDERIWQYVDKRGPDECWPWIGHASPRGYGRCRHGKSRLAHRAIFYIAYGYLPETVDHQCHNDDVDCPGGDSDPHRLCCNPTHLAARTAAENVAEAARTRRFCVNGHEVNDDGRRYGNYRCHECYRASRKRSDAKQAAKRAGGPGPGRKPTEACAKGHPWVEGSYSVSQGHRSCRICKQERAKAAWAAKKAAVAQP